MGTMGTRDPKDRTFLSAPPEAPMSDLKTLEAQIEALTRAGFAQVEACRQATSTVEILCREQRQVSTKLGMLCDDLREYIQVSNRRHSDNERAIRESDSKIRVIESWRGRAEERIKALEEAVERAPSAATSR